MKTTKSTNRKQKAKHAKFRTSERCMYCGSSRIQTQADSSLHICQSCGLAASSHELWDAHNHLDIDGKQGSSADNAIYENEILASAWELMQKKAWDKALHILFPPTLPAQHHIEFAVYRGICQAAPALSSSDLQRRADLLNLLLHNIGCLDSFLPSINEKNKYRALHRMYEALLLLANEEITYMPQITTFDIIFGYSVKYTAGQLADILCCLAESLETQGDDAAHGTDYLKMSAELYHQCLVTAQKQYYIQNKDGRLDIRGIFFSKRELQLSPEIHKRINEKIRRLNAEIAQEDEDFTPYAVIHVPRVLPVWLTVLSAFMLFTTITFPFCCYYFINFFVYIGLEQYLPTTNDTKLTELLWMRWGLACFTLFIFVELLYNNFLFGIAKHPHELKDL